MQMTILKADRLELQPVARTHSLLHVKGTRYTAIAEANSGIPDEGVGVRSSVGESWNPSPIRI
jgi:hypothetical protein